MEKIKVLSIFGTRPEAIKMAPIIKEMEKCEHIHQEVCVTAQHREMLDQVLNIFNIKPDYDLNIMTQNQTLTGITVNALKGLEDILEKANPDIILVHGDTTTTFVGSLAAFYKKIKIGHVEAGLRTYNKYEPFPEEMNRKLTGAMADLHFSPTQLSKENLLKENIAENSIFITGNTSVDCVKTTVDKNYTFSCDVLNNIDYTNKKVITMTAHRRENLGEPLENICSAVLKLVQDNEDVEVVYAVHFNPLVREVANRILGDNSRIHLIDPVDMTDMHNLVDRSYMVMTDSGGLQEEVPSLKKPVLVLRNVTERPEGVTAGVLKLAGTEKDNIISLATELLNNKDLYNTMVDSKNPFGDGLASKRIVDAILYHFNKTDKKPENFN
ncbi:non-hydrolyzing UDP-N-acetylglucosamine 2-epimerase [uncultured Tyzzerella sp.]|uniref:non-hydrolyzing UDP-N-acetylglucosamine 2-epimerase n=1 Tax=uncultured Tyzzerella sp. TaxID=2321398 RepID=UPI00294387DB|nr:UDP-N-acetylglucosamine 2-epimerase (non-hydrolyzing) [uncultured Tyzzerella sp.]